MFWRRRVSWNMVMSGRSTNVLNVERTGPCRKKPNALGARRAVAPDGPGHGGLNMSRNRAYTFTAQCHAMPDPGGRDQQIFGEDT